MSSPDPSQHRAIPGLKVHQWMAEWDEFEFEESAQRRLPQPHFYLFSLSASDLRSLAGVQRRSTDARAHGEADSGIQRSHDDSRSAEISRFIRFGFPWSALSEARRRSGEYDDLKKPGWLPTAIVVNILDKEAQSYGLKVHDDDLVKIVDGGESTATLELPASFTGPAWEPQQDHPIQVIDGQHRLWAFGDTQDTRDYQLPVVAFYGLDLSWQAYLFYTINIKPQRINASLAYDLYPLLRTEDWLERIEGPDVYRETRSQELTQALWGNPVSPWYRHINMLGERGLGPMVRQAAWIRSLMATYVKSSRGTQIGGLFSGRSGEEVLPWNGAQQAAFLMFVGQKLKDAVTSSVEDWAEILRQDTELEEDGPDPAFYGASALLNTDQGIRGFLFVTNDLCYVLAEALGLAHWLVAEPGGANEPAAVEEALEQLDTMPVAGFLDELSSALVTFDWRTAAAEGLSEAQRVHKSAYRGSGGYRLLRGDLLEHLRHHKGRVGAAAEEVRDRAGFAESRT